MRDKLKPEQRAVFQRGIDVGILAQQLFPGGINLRPGSYKAYQKKANETINTIKSQQHSVLYEATFLHDQLLTILDILVKEPQGWIAYEVKSSLNISETYLLDAAFQYYVITHSGVNLNDFFLVTLRRDYVFEDQLDIEKLFSKQSVIKEVKALQDKIALLIEEEKTAITATSSPPISIGEHCFTPYPCDFRGLCWKKVKENSLLYLDAFPFSESLKRYFANEDAPDKIDKKSLTPLQQIQQKSAIKKQWVIDKTKLNRFTQKYLGSDSLLVVPFYVRMAIPRIQETRPYQHIPIAVAWKKLGNSKTNITFFTKEENPVKAFAEYFTKGSLFFSASNLIFYDISETDAFFNENSISFHDKKTALQSLFNTGILFHYLFRGDYSANKVATLLLNRKNPQLDASLIKMQWQTQYITEKDFSTTTQEATEKFLIHMTDFMEETCNYLINSI